MKYGDSIAKGTQVRVRTSNGGDGTFVLAETYRATYDAIVVVGRSWDRIPATRITSIEPTS